MSEVTNPDRAAFARAAVEAYKAARRTDEDTETEAQDLICDLVHLLVEEGNTVHEALNCVQHALFHFYCEHTGREPAVNNVVFVHDYIDEEQT